MKKIGSLAILLASALLILIQKVNAFTLDIDDNYFDGTSILTGNRAEINFQDNNNLGYGAFFLGTGSDTNTTLVLTGGNTNSGIICEKQFSGYYTILYNNFLMLGIDPGTVNYTNSNHPQGNTSQYLTENINFITGGLFTQCKYSHNDNALTGIFGYIEWTYGLNNEENTHRIRVGIAKNSQGDRQRGNLSSNTSPLELVYSNSDGYITKTLSGQFYSNLARTGKVLPRPIGDIWISGNNIEYENGVYIIQYEDFKAEGININIITSTPNQDVQVDINGQFEDEEGSSGNSVDSFNLRANSLVPSETTFDFGGFYGYTNTGYTKRTEYRELSGTITLIVTGANVSEPYFRSINFRVEGGEPCLSGRNNDYFITPDFWTMNRKQKPIEWLNSNPLTDIKGPTDAQIKCAIFGYGDERYNENNGAGWETAYTKGRADYTNGSCNNINVIRTGNLPSTLQANTIYVLTSSVVNINNNPINIPSCTAIISKMGVIDYVTGHNIGTTIYSHTPKIYYGKDSTLKDTQLNLNGEYIVLDNISVQANGNGININSGNNTLNVVKVYNGNIGINVNGASNVLLNNIQAFNNTIGIQLNGGSQNAINNTQAYRNDLGVYMTETTDNILYNSIIYQNETGLKVVSSNYNTFKELDLYNNTTGGNANYQNIYIGTGLINSGINVKQYGKTYIVEYDRTDGLIANGQTKLELSGRNRISLWKASNYTYEYTCQGGTIGTCNLRGNFSGDLQGHYDCTGTIREPYDIPTIYIEANGIYEDLPRNFTISGDSLSFDIEQTQVYTEEIKVEKIDENGQIQLNNEGYPIFEDKTVELQKNIHITGTKAIKMYRNIDSYHFDSTDDEIYGDLYLQTEDSTYTYNIDREHRGIKYSGSGIETLIYKNFSGFTNDLNELGDWLCEFDGGLSGYTTGDIDYDNPIIRGYTGQILPDSDTGKTNIFSYYSGLNEHSCSYANCMTNPRLTESKTGTSYLNAWTSIGHKKLSSNITYVYDYSYGAEIKRQKDVILANGTSGGLIRDKGSYNSYFIGSNVPAVQIGRTGFNKATAAITKIHYKLQFHSPGVNFGQTHYNINSLNEQSFPQGTVNNTILTGHNLIWSTDNVWRREIGNWTTGNYFMGKDNGTITELYLHSGDPKSYKVVVQTYGDKYFATHEDMATLSRTSIPFELRPTKRCRPPREDQVTMTGYRSTHEHEGIAGQRGNKTGANATGVRANIVYITGSTANNIFFQKASLKTGSFIKVSRTGRAQWIVTMPCETGKVCTITGGVKSAAKSYIRDMREFMMSNTEFRQYRRDMQGPTIKVSKNNKNFTTLITGITYDTNECVQKKLYIKLTDDCIGSTGYTISGFVVSGVSNDDYPHYIPFAGGNNNTSSFIVTSGYIGRTGSTSELGNIIKTGYLEAEDIYGNWTTGKIVELKITDVTPTLEKGKTQNTPINPLTGKRITGYTTDYKESHELYPIDLLKAKEGNCGTDDLYIENFNCFDPNNNVPSLLLTGIIEEDNGRATKLTVQPNTGEDGVGYFSGLICTIQIKDNEGSATTGYMIFRVNTIHKPVFGNPTIVSGTQYIDYDHDDLILDGYLENTNRDDREGLKIKYSSGDTVYISIAGERNEYIEYYYISCSGYYTNTGNIEQNGNITETEYAPRTPYNNEEGHTIDSGGELLLIFTGLDECNTGVITGIKVSIRNGRNEPKPQITTGDADYIFYDYTNPKTEDIDNDENTTNTPYFTQTNNAIIITSGGTIENDVQVIDRSDIDHRFDVPGYIYNSYIENTGILSLLIGEKTLSTIMAGKINDGRDNKGPIVKILGTILEDLTDTEIQNIPLSTDETLNRLRDRETELENEGKYLYELGNIHDGNAINRTIEEALKYNKINIDGGNSIQLNTEQWILLRKWRKNDGLMELISDRQREIYYEINNLGENLINWLDSRRIKLQEQLRDLTYLEENINNIQGNDLYYRDEDINTIDEDINTINELLINKIESRSGEIATELNMLSRIETEYNANTFPEKRIKLQIDTGLLHDFSINDAKPLDIYTKYRYTNKNPIFVNGRWAGHGPEGDISRLIVQIETGGDLAGQINTGNLKFTLLTAKPITEIDCTGYREDIGYFGDCEILTDQIQELTAPQENTICISWYTLDNMPKCIGSYDSYNIYSGTNHRKAQFNRKYQVSYNIFSGEDTGYYFQSDHSGEWKFYGKVSLIGEDRYNDEYVIIQIVDKKSPFKVGLTGLETDYYKTIFDALTETSGDNSFFFYITHPQRINIPGGLRSGMVGDISYEIEFSTGVADEFYYITGESTVNGYKESIGIKRPTFNYANPKGYLFNFPDYTYYE